MTLPKKTSRVLSVDGHVYRWTVGRSVLDSTHVLLTFMAHPERSSKSEPQSKLTVAFYESHCDVVTPSLATRFVQKAIEQGWDPKGQENFHVYSHEAVNYICEPSLRTE